MKCYKNPPLLRKKIPVDQNKLVRIRVVVSQYVLILNELMFCFTFHRKIMKHERNNKLNENYSESVTCIL